MDASGEKEPTSTIAARGTAHARRGRRGADVAPAVDEPKSVPGVIDLPSLARAAVADGPVWTHASIDLNVNLIVVNGPGGVPDHTNDEVDVVFIGVEGTGIIAIDGMSHPLVASSLVVVLKGAPWTHGHGGTLRVCDVPSTAAIFVALRHRTRGVVVETGSRGSASCGPVRANRCASHAHRVVLLRYDSFHSLRGSAYLRHAAACGSAAQGDEHPVRGAPTGRRRHRS